MAGICRMAGEEGIQGRVHIRKANELRASCIYYPLYNIES